MTLNFEQRMYALIWLTLLAITSIVGSSRVAGADGIISENDLAPMRPTNSPISPVDYGMAITGDITYGSVDPLERILLSRNAFFSQNKRARKISSFMPMRGKKSDSLFNLYTVAPLLKSRLAEASARQQQAFDVDQDQQYQIPANRGYLSAIVDPEDDRAYLVQNKLRRASGFTPMRGKREAIDSSAPQNYETMPMEEYLSDPLV